MQGVIKEGVSYKGSSAVGLLNGLMPCGPLQAMQLYALSTGSLVAGGISRFSKGSTLSGVGGLSQIHASNSADSDIVIKDDVQIINSTL